MAVLEKLVRKLARATRVDGAPALLTGGDPDLVEAFEELGWDDPHVEAAAEPESEAAVLGEPEEVATEPRPKSRGKR